MKALRLVILCLFATTLFGCASSAQMQNMVYHADKTVNGKFDPALHQTVAVKKVAGGESTNPLWTSEIGNPEFRGALSQSLKEAGLLAEAGTAKYALSAELVKVDKPLIGLDMTVTTQVRYTLVAKDTGKPVFSEVITAPYTATFSDSALAVKRLRLANEGSARKNIGDFLNALVKLHIPIQAVSLSK